MEHVHHHHTIEEEYYFPALEKKLGAGALEAPLSQHGDFVPQMNEFSEWLGNIKAGKEPYDGELLAAKVNAFSDIMFNHLNEVSRLHHFSLLS